MRLSEWKLSDQMRFGVWFWSYPDGLGGEVALGNHEVASFVQFDDGTRVGLHLRFKRLVFLELSLRDTDTLYKKEGRQRPKGTWRYYKGYLIEKQKFWGFRGKDKTVIHDIIFYIHVLYLISHFISTAVMQFDLNGQSLHVIMLYCQEGPSHMFYNKPI